MDIIRNIGGLIIFPGGLFVLVMAFMLAGYDRVIVARMQRRKGPKCNIAFMDFVKLIGKDTIIPRNSNEALFLFAPILALVTICMIPAFLPVMNYSIYSDSVNIFILIFLLMLPTIITIIGAVASASPFATIGAARLLLTFISYELPLVIVILAVAKKSMLILKPNEIQTIASIIDAQKLSGNFIFTFSLLPAAIALLMIIPPMISSNSLTSADSDTEISGGIFAEYSGLHLGIFKLVESIRAYVVITLFIVLFLGNIWITSRLSVVNVIVNSLIFILVVVVIFTALFTIIKSIMGRYKYTEVFKFYLIVPTVLSLLSYILVTFKI